MQYPPYPQGNSPRRRGLVWALVGTSVLASVLVIVVIILLTKPDASSTSSSGSGPSIATADTQAPQNTPQGTQAPLADVYAGTSMNHTAPQFGLDGNANLKLRFTNKNPNALAGEIEVDGPDVGGTGLFKGTLSRDMITLDVSPQDGAPPFQLTGTLKTDGSIKGSFTVPLGELSQSGEWQVQPQR